MHPGCVRFRSCGPHSPALDLPEDNDLFTDLIGPEYSLTGKQQIQLERKLAASWENPSPALWAPSPGPSRGGLGRGRGESVAKESPLPLLASPLKGG